MDGYPPGAPLVEFAIADLVTVKPPWWPTARHSRAPEPHSLFCTVYTPPSTASRCEPHSAALPALPPGAPEAAAPGELTGTPAGLCAPAAAGRPLPVMPPTIITTPPRTTTTASTATTTKAFLLCGTGPPSQKLSGRHLFGQRYLASPPSSRIWLLPDVCRVFPVATVPGSPAMKPNRGREPSPVTTFDA